MGNKQSSTAVKTTDETCKVVEEISEVKDGGGGRKSSDVVMEASVSESDTDSDSDSDYEEDEEDVEDDEELMERLQILEDARQLKQLAVAFLHPERPVEVDPTASARCFFNRASAPEQETSEEANYREMVLADAAALKQAAIYYMYPERLVVTTDAAATARCFFDRASAPEQESLEEAEERAMVLADAAALKKLAVDYMHPEMPVVTTDATATARCYFDRASAPEQESLEEVEEREMALADAAALKKLAIDYMHPERPIEVDATATARCYFDRASAPEQESLEEAEERAMALADAAALKKLAIDYMHPERPVVTTDATATARCYFDRASASEQESVEEVEERDMVLADAAALKKLAIDYMHPERPVITTDATATARCYFDRASAPEQESLEEVEERAMALADAAALKKLAIDYMHPEMPVVTTDATATARCYFDRSSARREDQSVSSSKPSKNVHQKTKSLAKIVGTTKTISTQMEFGGINKSASRVELYGLDAEHGDAY